MIHSLIYIYIYIYIIYVRTHVTFTRHGSIERISVSYSIDAVVGNVVRPRHWTVPADTGDDSKCPRTIVPLDIRPESVDANIVHRAVRRRVVVVVVVVVVVWWYDSIMMMMMMMILYVSSTCR